LSLQRPERIKSRKIKVVNMEDKNIRRHKPRVFTDSLLREERGERLLRWLPNGRRDGREKKGRVKADRKKAEQRRMSRSCSPLQHAPEQNEMKHRLKETGNGKESEVVVLSESLLVHPRHSFSTFSSPVLSHYQNTRLTPNIAAIVYIA